MKKRVLFLCTGNSARSQMAEGILRNIAADKYDARSAGTHPKGIHPQTVAAMAEIGIDVGKQISKNVGQFSGQSFDYVITVCDQAREQCPIFPAAASVHWSFEDPAEASPDKQEGTFRRVRDEIQQRIRLFVASNRF